MSQICIILFPELDTSYLLLGKNNASVNANANANANINKNSPCYLRMLNQITLNPGIF